MKNIKENVVFLSGQGNHQLGSEILKELTELFGTTCSFNHINFNTWPDGELDDRIARYQDIQGKIVVFYQCITDLLRWQEITDLIWAAKYQYKAKHIIGMFPFLWNRRQDPISTEEDRDVLSMKKPLKPDEVRRLEKTIHILKVCGVDEMLVVAPHSNAMERYCNKYEIKFHEIDPSVQFQAKILTFVPEDQYNLISIYSPDIGSIQRAIRLAKLLQCPVLFNEKNRPVYNKVEIVQSDIKERTILENELRQHYGYKKLHYVTQELVTERIIVMNDDEISSGSTANGTADALLKFKPLMILFFGSHPVLTPGWKSTLFRNNPFTKVGMTNSIHRGYEKRTGGLVTDISVAPIVASKLFRVLNNLLK